MDYGYFDDEKKEYVITNPATPLSWSNYLGSTRYGAIITNNAGGYSFFRSSAQGRFLRMHFNAVPLDQPGRYVYLHDRETKDYWSGSWQPVGKPSDSCKYECRHGSAYTKISSDYAKIKCEILFFVPLNADYELWHVKISNHDNKPRCLRAFTYVEFASNWNSLDDQNNLQYTQYIVKTEYFNNAINHGSNLFIPPQPDNFQEKDQGRSTFIGIAGAEVTGFDSDREKFIGLYRDYGNPITVENGECSNSLTEGDNGCGSLQIDINLKPGETTEFTVIMGIGHANKEGQKAISEYPSSHEVNKAFTALKDYWHERIEGIKAQTPDPDFNSMFNMWNPYNNLITYSWSRAASLVYSGERDGLGFRDTIQDMLGVLHCIPEEACERLELMLSGQLSSGGAMPIVKPFAHKPGKEPILNENEYRSDDSLWLFYTVPAYVKETGSIDFYNKTIAFADKGEASVLEHLKKAIEFNLNRIGANQLPCGLAADWNDCLILGEKGESVFVALQLRHALITFIDICVMLSKTQEVTWATDQLITVDKTIELHAWEDERYIRAYRHDGLKFGSKQNEEGSLYLNPQTWAVLSGHASKKRARQIMGKVNEKLATEYGIVLLDPPYEKTEHTVVRAPLFNKGMKENAAIFSHTQGWAVMAETILGNGNRAYDYHKSYLPSAYNSKAEIRQTEPYVYSQTTNSKYNSRFGASRNPWLSGTASWAYYSAAQYILGIRPGYGGLLIDPCIPSYWEGFTVQRNFRGKLINIEVKNPSKVQKGIKEIILNGQAVEGNLLPAEILKSINEVKVMMGK